ncbi:hypothetical protein ACNKHL_11905 [Shigella flexneri]
MNLFARIGGIRRGFESIGGHACLPANGTNMPVRTYKANHYCEQATHHFNEDIRDIASAIKKA